MKNWKTCDADVVKIIGKHFTSGRSGKKVEFIGIHYMAGNLTTEQCYSVWQTREASAHYCVEDDGRIGQVVWDRDTAWSLGDFDANCRSINIEHANRSDGTVTDKCLDAGAHLTAALCHMYGLGRPTWGENMYPHKHFSSTSCPGELYGSQKAEYQRRAREWYDEMGGGGGSSKPSTSDEKLVVDGLWGEKTTLALQKVLKAPYKDGTISRQNPQHKNRLNACTGGWEYVYPDGMEPGSPTIKLLQKKTGSVPDGIMGPDTINDLIAYFMKDSGATEIDGKLDYNSPTVKAMQRSLNEGKF